MNRITILMSAVALLAPLTGHAQAPGPQPPAAQSGTSTAGGRVTLRERFEAANTAHDGHLTLAEAQAGGLRRVARSFDAIDASHKGYVTLDDIRQFRQARRAARQPGLPPAPDR